MTSILSTISGYFSKPLILGSFLPVIIFTLLSLLLLVPILPPGYPIFQPLEGLEKEWRLLAISFIAIVASGLIYNLNIQILRLYEGYPWRDSWIGRLRTKRFHEEFKRTEAHIKGLRALLRAMDAAKDSNEPSDAALVAATITRLQATGISLEDIDAKDKQWSKMWFTDAEYQANLVKERWKRIHELVLNHYTRIVGRFRVEFPQEDWLVLPTRLGNMIRSFEHYPKREYGIDGSEMWPRLIANLDKEYAVTVDDAKTSFDFFITSSMLSGFLSAALIVVAFMRPMTITGRGVLVATLIKSVIFALLSYGLYLLAISRAEEWGKTVKSAFDLYRWKLLSQLGYKRELNTRFAERELWKEISRQTIYGDSFKKNPLDYVDEKPPVTPFAAHGGPGAIQLEISRGIQLTAQSNRLKIFLRIKNTDTAKQIDNIVVTDKLPDGLHYEWDSAASDVGAVVVSGSNPYKFTVTAQLPASQSLTLSYSAISLTANQTHNVGFHLGTL